MQELVTRVMAARLMVSGSSEELEDRTAVIVSVMWSILGAGI